MSFLREEVKLSWEVIWQDEVSHVSHVVKS